jgi:hypothetical protein
MFNIVGVREKSFSVDNDGEKRLIHGFQVFCTDDSNRKVDGLSTTDFFLSDSVCERSSFTPYVGACIDTVNYNRFGRIISVVPVSK